MIQKKVCLLGAFAVGKTSLIRRFVDSLFSEKYHTTVGVKVDKKMQRIHDEEVMLMLWDLAGEDEFCRLRASYLRGTAGYVIVVDGTRPRTIDKAVHMHSKAKETVGGVPIIVALNKSDLRDEWQVEESQLGNLTGNGCQVLKTSAKSGDGVAELFQRLTDAMVKGTV